VGLYISKVVEVHTYKTDWCRLDEQSVIEKYVTIFIGFPGQNACFPSAVTKGG